METRNSDLDESLKVLYQSLPFDMRDEVVARAPRRLSTLFAMSSSYWRSYFYLQQFQIAVAEKQHEEQERILTKLIINVELLKKTDARGNLSRWITYLQSFFLRVRSIFRKNTLLAQALYLMLNEKRQPRELAEFEFLSRSFFNNGTEAVHLTLQAMVAGSDSVPTADGRLKLADLLTGESRFTLLWKYAKYAKKYEAQLVIALLVRIGCGPTDILFGLLDACGGDSDVLHLANACVNLMSPKDRFWQKKKYFDKRFVKLFLAPQLLASHDVYELMVNTAKNINETDVKKIAVKLKKELPPGRASIVTAKQFSNLQNDNDRIAMLKNELEQVYSSKDEGNLFYVKKICGALVTDEGCAEAVMQLRFGLLPSSSSGRHNTIADLIRMLLYRMHNQSLKTTTVKDLCEYYLTIQNSFPRVFLNDSVFQLVFEWFPSAAYQQQLQVVYQKYKSVLGNEEAAAMLPYDSDEMALLKKFCEAVKSPIEIDEWLINFKVLVDQINNKIDSYYCKWSFAYVCFTKLACKKKDPSLLREWLDKLYSQAILTIEDPPLCMLWLGSAMEVLPLASPSDEDNIKWLDLIYKFSVSQESRLFFTPTIKFFYSWLNCLESMLPRLSKALRSEYSSKIYPMLAENARLTTPTGKGFFGSLEGTISRQRHTLLPLLRALPDEMVFSLSPTTARSIQAPQHR